ncbi:unnamed protein product [Caretta caretta]
MEYKLTHLGLPVSLSRISPMCRTAGRVPVLAKEKGCCQTNSVMRDSLKPAQLLNIQHPHYFTPRKRGRAWVWQGLFCFGCMGDSLWYTSLASPPPGMDLGTFSTPVSRHELPAANPPEYDTWGSLTHSPKASQEADAMLFVHPPDTLFFC